ncbi:MAG TPA: sialidase family protein, partial [Phycisphaeraceae bacterium]
MFRYGKADPYDRTNLYGFNHAPSVTLLADGRLLAAWFSGPYEASVHQVILGSFSDDGGATWSPAQVLQDDPRRSDFDPAFLADGNRTWLCFSVGRWNRYPFVGLRDAEKREVGVDSFRLMMRVSEDAGATWSDAVQVLPETGWGPRSNGIRLASGELVLPIYRFKRPRIAALLCSRDSGATWQRLGTVEGPGGMDVVEPSVAQVSSGKLLMVLRTADGRLWMASSENRGQTW